MIKTTHICILMTIAFTASSCDIPQNNAQIGQTNASAVGRYAIVHSPHVQRDTQLLDTATGKTWQLVRLGKDEDAGVGWQSVNKIQDNSSSASQADEPVTWEIVNSVEPKKGSQTK
jgi:hypothetical protein